MYLSELFIRIDPDIAERYSGAVYRRIHNDSACLVDLWTAEFRREPIETDDVRSVAITFSENPKPDIIAVHSFQWEFPAPLYCQMENSLLSRVGVIHNTIREALCYLAKARGWEWERLAAAAQDIERSGYVYQAERRKKGWSADRRFGVTAGVRLSPDNLKLVAFLYRRGNAKPCAVREFAEFPPVANAMNSFIAGVRHLRDERWEICMPRSSFLRKKWVIDFAPEATLSDALH